MPWPQEQPRLRKDGQIDRRGQNRMPDSHPWFRYSVGKAQYQLPEGYTRK